VPTPAALRARVLPLALLGGAVLFWGTSFAATKAALGSFAPMTVIWLRMMVATLVIAPFLPMLPRPRYRAGDWKLLAMSGLFIPCFYYLLEGYAVRYTTSSQAGVVSAVVPLIVAVGAWAFLKERLTTRSVIAIAASLAGVAMLSLGAVGQASASNPLLGNSLELLAMVAAAGSTLSIKRLTERYDAWFLTGMQAVVGAVFFLPFALADGIPRVVSAPLTAWACVAYLGVFASLGAFGLYNTALKRMPASRASLAINLVPAVALLTGWLALGDSLSPMQLVACAVIVGAVVYAEAGTDDSQMRLQTERP
jgi:drug/metabolite transporter (DMT)-like permease